MDELERTVVGSAGSLVAAEPAQELGAGRVEVVVAVEIETVDERERGLDVARLGDRGCVVQLTTGEPVRRASSP